LALLPGVHPDDLVDVVWRSSFGASRPGLPGFVLLLLFDEGISLLLTDCCCWWSALRKKLICLLLCCSFLEAVVLVGWQN